MGKDRTRRHRLAANARLVIERSSTHPVRYAITLHVLRDDEWVCIHTFDNSHAPDEHHEHAYVGAVKMAPQVTNGAINEAMAQAEIKIKEQWSDIIRRWEDQ